MIKRTISKNTKQNTQDINNRDEVLFHKEIYSHNIEDEIIYINDNNRDGFFTIPVISSDWDNKVDNGELVSKFPHQLNHNIKYSVELTSNRATGGEQAPLGIYIADVIKADGINAEIKIELNISPLENPNIDDLCVIDIVDCNIPININIIDTEIKYCVRVKNASDVTINGALLSGNDTYNPLSIESSNIKLYSTTLQGGLTFCVKKASLVLINSDIKALEGFSISHKDKDGIPADGELDASIHVDSELYQWMIDNNIIAADQSISIQNSKIFAGFQNILNNTYDKVEDILQESDNLSSYQAEYQTVLQGASSISINDRDRQVIEEHIFDLSGTLASDFIARQDNEGNIVFSWNSYIHSLHNQCVVVDLMVYGMPISHAYGTPGLRQQILAFCNYNAASAYGSLTYVIPHNTELGQLLQTITDEYRDYPLFFAAPKVIVDTSEYTSRRGECKGRLKQVFQFGKGENSTGSFIVIKANSVNAESTPFRPDWQGYLSSESARYLTNGFIIDTTQQEKVILQAGRSYLICFEVMSFGFCVGQTLRSGIAQSASDISFQYTFEEVLTEDNESSSRYRCHFNLFRPNQDIELGPIQDGSSWSAPFIEINPQALVYLLDCAVYDVTDIFAGVEDLLPFYSNFYERFENNQKDQYLFGPSNLFMFSDNSDHTKTLSNIARNPYGETASTAYLLDNYFLDFRKKVINPNTVLTDQIEFGPSKGCISEEANEESKALYEQHIGSIRLNPKFNIVRPFFNIEHYDSSKHVIINVPQMKKYYMEGVSLLPSINGAKAVMVFEDTDRVLQKEIESLIVYPVSRLIRENRFQEMSKNIQVFIKKNRNLINDLQTTEEFYLAAIPYQTICNIIKDGTTTFNFKVIFDDHFKIKDYFILQHECETIKWEHNSSVNSVWNEQSDDSNPLWSIDITNYLFRNLDNNVRTYYFGFKGFQERPVYPQPQVTDKGCTTFNFSDLNASNTIIMYNNPNNDWIYPVINQLDWTFHESNSPILYK